MDALLLPPNYKEVNRLAGKLSQGHSSRNVIVQAAHNKRTRKKNLLPVYYLTW